MPTLTLPPTPPTSPEDLIERCQALLEAHPPPDLLPLLEHTGAPTLDMVVTPLAARAALLGATSGIAFYHHELRVRLPMPPELEPEIHTADVDTTPFWNEGVLNEHKYFSFSQDASLLAYNPNHRRKWRPHEMLHAAHRFFWHPAMTRFECYLSARICELLPVVLWYGFDEIFRPRCPLHHGKHLYRHHCPACEHLATPYWTPNSNRIDTSTSLAFAESALEHLESERKAIQQELETGRPVSTPRVNLDASSDAIGYVRGHWNRLTAWSFGAWVERFLIPDVDVFSTLPRLAENADAVARQLLSGAISLELPDYTRRRDRRVLQDLAYRVYIALEHLDENHADTARAEDALREPLEVAAEHAHALGCDAPPGQSVQDTLATLLAAFDEAFPKHPEIHETLRTDAFRALGYCWPGQPPPSALKAAQPLLLEGLTTALPEARNRIDLEARALDFAGSPQFKESTRLASRFAAWYADQDDADPIASAWARLDAWLAEEPRSDLEADDFATLPESLDVLMTEPGTLRAQATLRRAEFPPTIIEHLTQQADATRLIAIRKQGELRLMVEDRAMHHILDVLEEGQTLSQTSLDSSARESLELLLDNGFLVWLPRPRS